MSEILETIWFKTLLFDSKFVISSEPMSNYDHKRVEKKWQKKWEENRIYSPDLENTKPKDKFYNLWMYPYPSGEGLHAGHAFASTGSDAYGRFMRMKGKTVFQPMGYDSFGIHSENYAIKTGEHPSVMLDRTTKNFERQSRALGHGYDWTRTMKTSDVEYYKWTQWLFVQLFQAGLAYRKEAPVNWCPSCKTVLADEQVIIEKVDVQRDSLKTHEGIEAKQKRVCERCGTEVEIRNLAQWFFRITNYADRLLVNLDKIDWTEKVVTAQRNWIGKKEGINIKYELKTKDEIIKDKFVVCWTSRPETNFGATFVVVSPEYAKANLIDIIAQDRIEEAKRYIDISLDKSQEERQIEGRKKTGVLTGLLAVNPLNSYEMPVYIADFVLSGVGTGAVVGVPGHDKRDFEFATEFGLPIKRVVIGDNNDDSDIKELTQVQEDNGVMVNSEFLDGLNIHAATVKMMDYLEGKDFGTRTTNYHLRDWLISRQRYWGPPIPMIYCSKCKSEGKGWLGSDKHKKWLQQSKFKSKSKKQVTGNWNLETGNSSDWSSAGWWPEENLPVELPNLTDYKPKGTGRGPLADHPEFYEVKCPHCGSQAKRETDVSDTFLDSAWYFLRYPSVKLEQESKEDKFPISKQISNTKSKQNLETGNSKLEIPWDPDITRHWLPVDLYFGGAEHSVLHLMYARFVTMALHDLGFLEFEEPFPKFFAHGLMIKDGAKMSKSKGNVVNPDEYIEKFGADTLRLYLMFMGPMDGYPDFRDTGIEGMRKFVQKVWGLFENSNFQIPDVNSEEKSEIGNSKLETEQFLLTKMHQTIKKVTEDIGNYRYNTAIASIMEYVNTLRVQIPISNSQFSDKSQTSSSKVRSTNYDLPSTIYLKVLVLLIAPFAPHLAEEVWELLTKNEKLKTKNESSIHLAKWPEYDAKMIVEDVVTIAIQVNGKLRTTLQVSREESENKDKLIKLAKADPKVSKWIEGKQIRKEIFIPGKLVNFVL